jgi:hypothetical protein
MRQREDETAIEFLRRVVEWLGCEYESLLDDLPSVQAVLDYVELWTVYDTELMSGIIECIQVGDNPQPFLDFVRKYDLKWEIPSEIQ